MPDWRPYLPIVGERAPTRRQPRPAQSSPAMLRGCRRCCPVSAYHATCSGAGCCLQHVAVVHSGTTSKLLAMHTALRYLVILQDMHPCCAAWWVQLWSACWPLLQRWSCTVSSAAAAAVQSIRGAHLVCSYEAVRVHAWLVVAHRGTHSSEAIGQTLKVATGLIQGRDGGHGRGSADIAAGGNRGWMGR